jgi:hypothetical protein
VEKELASAEKKARIARASAEQEEQNLLAERRRHDVLTAQVTNAQLQLRPGPQLLKGQAWRPLPCKQANNQPAPQLKISEAVRGDRP